jgi:hypothetical protein
MERYSDSETSPLCSLSEDECDVKEDPLPTAFCDVTVSVYFCIFIILSTRNLFIYMLEGLRDFMLHLHNHFHLKSVTDSSKTLFSLSQ